MLIPQTRASVAGSNTRYSGERLTMNFSTAHWLPDSAGLWLEVGLRVTCSGDRHVLAQQRAIQPACQRVSPQSGLQRKYFAGHLLNGSEQKGRLRDLYRG